MSNPDTQGSPLLHDCWGILALHQLNLLKCFQPEYTDSQAAGWILPSQEDGGMLFISNRGKGVDCAAAILAQLLTLGNHLFRTMDSAKGSQMHRWSLFYLFFGCHGRSTVATLLPIRDERMNKHYPIIHPSPLALSLTHMSTGSFLALPPHMHAASLSVCLSLSHPQDLSLHTLNLRHSGFPPPCSLHHTHTLDFSSPFPFSRRICSSCFSNAVGQGALFSNCTV